MFLRFMTTILPKTSLLPSNSPSFLLHSWLRLALFKRPRKPFLLLSYHDETGFFLNVNHESKVFPSSYPSNHLYPGGSRPKKNHLYTGGSRSNLLLLCRHWSRYFLPLPVWSQSFVSTGLNSYFLFFSLVTNWKVSLAFYILSESEFRSLCYQC